MNHVMGLDGMTIEELNNDIYYLCYKTAEINACIVFYRQLIDIHHETPEKYSKATNFFNSVTSAYDYGIICNLFNILDKKGEAGNIYILFKNVLKFIKNRDDVALKRLEKCNNLLDEIESQKPSIMMLRNKRFAHTDRRYYLNPGLLFKKANFDLKKFEELTEKITAFLSELYSILNNESKSFSTTLCSGYDLYNLIKE